MADDLPIRIVFPHGPPTQLQSLIHELKELIEKYWEVWSRRNPSVTGNQIITLRTHISNMYRYAHTDDS